ncbi:MAG: class I SAM-dependent methyltransferase [Planctomycetota bacterium]
MTAVTSHFGAQLFCNELSARLGDLANLKILVAGCGSGHEAFVISEQTQAEVHAIDIEDFLEVDEEQRSQINFQTGTVCELPFAQDEFDAVFYYHVIEHVDQPAESVKDIYRVVKPEGWVFIGTPNRSRLLSSLGAHQQSEWDPTLWNKFCDNVRDWKDRLTGRFHNHLGAHAGFTTGELHAMVAPVFDRVEWVTQTYIRGKYRSHRLKTLIQLMTTFPLCYFTAPSIYAWCKK